ncbi:uncharacterized protein cubi_01944 [Cryptosporidium ubiquitum]|uniref:C2H2-type domain-containing protein n=1 Tax=Cryptosporidium ubiquitum TaxID=857276 RepID=A0A1J4MN02_9CRYT|nr:uncharacterized protein cubi_01944 [Cryptosporidium ubiquitum]OII75423.1 hypothetical protein cubi_01944 [Cryptosporidium ubiquitum]
MAYSKILLIISFVILILHQVLCDQNCSRPISRRVSHSIRQLLKNERGISKYLRPECAFNQENHIFNHEESIKIVYPTGERQCGFCGEIFQEEKTYDQHMEKFHSHPQSGEFFCAEKLCTIFGQCGEPARLHACKSVMKRGDILEFCQKTVRSCFSENHKDSKFIGINLSQKLCNKERILEVNGCVEKVQQNRFSLSKLFFQHFSKVLLIFIMLTTFFLSYKMNEYLNKVK